jgi:HEXXH motif-containing protein
MSTRYHQMPAELFAAMASGSGGPETARILSTAQHSKHALLMRGVVVTSAAAGHAEAPVAQYGYDLLCTVQQHDPAAVTRLIRHPSVGAWAYRTVLALRGRATMKDATPGRLAAIAAAAAIRAGYAPRLRFR